MMPGGVFASTSPQFTQDNADIIFTLNACHV